MPSPVTQEMLATHQDRPTPKRQIPFRLVPGKPERIEWDQFVEVDEVTGNHVVSTLEDKTIDGRNSSFKRFLKVDEYKKNARKVPMFVNIQTSPYTNQVGQKIKEFMAIFYETEAQVDKLLAQIDELTTKNVLLAGERDKLQNQLSEALRQLKNGAKK